MGTVMRVVDLRNLFTSCNDRLIDVCGDFIYYAEEKSDEGHHNLFLLEYNQLTKRERILTSFFLDPLTLVQRIFSFPEEIMVVMENGSGGIRVVRVEKQSGGELGSSVFGLVGSFSDCLALDEYRLLVYTSEDEVHRAVFQEYRRLTGFVHAVALFDLGDGSCSYLRDSRICTASPTEMIPFDAQGERCFLLLQPNGTEEDKKKGYEAITWLGDNINDNIWRISLFDFTVSARAGEPNIPFDLILSAGTSGLVRYIGMDEENLYFRMLYYPWKDQRLGAVEKKTGKKRVAASLNLEEGEADASFCIEEDYARVYKQTVGADTYTMEGILNSNLRASYSRDLGDFIACVEDRFIVTRTVLSDDRDAFTFHSIYDTETGKHQSFECACAVRNDCIILY